MKIKLKRSLPAAAVAAAVGLAACGGGDNETNPLAYYQWAINHASSYFSKFKDVSDGKTDLNVAAVHQQGHYGKGVRVLVLDDGMEVGHEDLAGNVDRARTYNFETGAPDSTPALNADNVEDAHGTAVAGIIAAVDNGVGGIGVAPGARLGAGVVISLPSDKEVDWVKALGGAPWSEGADVVNMSFGSDSLQPAAFDGPDSDAGPYRATVALRDGKGAVLLKAAGNSFETDANNSACLHPSLLADKLGCSDAAVDTNNLEVPVIVVGAVNAKGIRSSYSSTGSVLWVAGLGGEDGDKGLFGEGGGGPTLYSTDLSGCARGFSLNGLTTQTSKEFDVPGSKTNREHNKDCSYTSMNGTSAATPTVTGVVALMLEANPKLSWRDVRHILAKTSRTIDSAYPMRTGIDGVFDLASGARIVGASPKLVHGSSSAPLEFGWQRNAAGFSHSNWYGFGLVDAKAAVEMARGYSTYMPATLSLAAWQTIASVDGIPANQVTLLGQFSSSGDAPVDALQLRINGGMCAGTTGIYVVSPAGTVSALSTPYNSYAGYDTGKVSQGLSTYAFYGEPQKGTWSVFAVAGSPKSPGCEKYAAAVAAGSSSSTTVEARIVPTF